MLPILGRQRSNKRLIVTIYWHSVVWNLGSFDLQAGTQAQELRLGERFSFAEKVLENPDFSVFNTGWTWHESSFVCREKLSVETGSLWYAAFDTFYSVGQWPQLLQQHFQRLRRQGRKWFQGQLTWLTLHYRPRHWGSRTKGNGLGSFHRSTDQGESDIPWPIWSKQKLPRVKVFCSSN